MKKPTLTKILHQRWLEKDKRGKTYKTPPPEDPEEAFRARAVRYKYRNKKEQRNGNGT